MLFITRGTGCIEVEVVVEFYLYFPTVGFWIGRKPCRNKSCATHHGHITKQGSPHLRWVLNQCARIHIKTEPDGTIAAFYSKLARKKGGHKAIVAASAKLLKIVFWVLKERREYHS